MRCSISFESLTVPLIKLIREKKCRLENILSGIANLGMGHKKNAITE